MTSAVVPGAFGPFECCSITIFFLSLSLSLFFSDGLWRQELAGSEVRKHVAKKSSRKKTENMLQRDENVGELSATCMFTCSGVLLLWFYFTMKLNINAKTLQMTTCELMFCRFF